MAVTEAGRLGRDMAGTATAVPFGLMVRHRLATSPLGRPVKALSALTGLRNRLSHAELGLLRKEGDYVEHALKTLIRTDSVCVDIGAHIGSMTYRFVQLAPAGKVFAIEAISEKAAMIARRFPQVEVFDCAVSDSPGTVTFFENLTHPGFSSLANRKSRGRTRERKVEACRLDDLIPEQLTVDFIKMDVEGFELEATKGSRRVIETSRPALLFEAGARGDQDFDDDRYIELFRHVTGDLDYDVLAAFDFCYGRGPLSLDMFVRYRTYPFLAFNYLALPKTPRPSRNPDRPKMEPTP